MASFSLESSESGQWFELLGRGSIMYSLTGTWVGTVVLQTRDPDGTTQDVDDATYTANQGVTVLDCDAAGTGPYKFAFTRTSGTAVCNVWSAQSMISFPYARALQDGGEWLTEAGEVWEMENA